MLVRLGIRSKGRRKYAVTQEIYIMKRKPFQQLPSTITCVAGSERVLLLFKGSTLLDTDVKQSCIRLPNPTLSVTLKATKGLYFIYTLSCGVATSF